MEEQELRNIVVATGPELLREVSSPGRGATSAPAWTTHTISLRRAAWIMKS